MSDNKLTLKERQSISLEIMKNVHNFCVENGIRYYLISGTLLGAIRHKGFIPWDDDIDIMMPRPDYEKFLELYVDKNNKVLRPQEGMYSYAKVYDARTIKYEYGRDYHNKRIFGIDIDIFVLDGIINDTKILDKIYKKEAVLEKLIILANQPIMKKGILKAINRIIPRIIGAKRLVKVREKNASQFDYDKSDFVVRMRYCSKGFTGIMKKEDYEPPVLVKFEDCEFYAPNNYDLWLSNFYGDYMKLPPKEKQVAHECNCFWRENEN